MIDTEWFCRIAVGLIIVVAGAVVSGCSQEATEVSSGNPGESAGQASVVDPDAAPASVLLITVDTTRADRLGCYGYGRNSTPEMDALAQEGVLFENFYAHTPITLPSHTSILSSLTPAAHGVHDNGIFTVPDEVLTIPEILKEQQYQTGAVVAAFVLDSRYNLDQGFDTYNDNYMENWSEDELQLRRRHSTMILERKADLVYQAAAEWLDVTRGPFFLWVHFFDPHQPLNAPSPWSDDFYDDLYDAEMAFMDHYIGMLLDKLEQTGHRDNTLVVLTGDHGEGLGDHDEPTHAMLLFDSTLHVPCIMRFPGGQYAGTRISDPAASVDIAPTILDYLGLETPAVFEGLSLMPTIADGEMRPDRGFYHENYLPHHSFGWSTLRAWRQGGWKYIEAPRPLLFQYTEDRGEIHNRVTAPHTPLVALETALLDYVDSVQAPESQGAQSMDAEAIAALEALGYVGGAPPATGVTPGTGPDPNELVGTQTVLSYVRHALSAGQLVEASEALREVLLYDPNNAQAYSMKAKVALQRNRPHEAADMLDRAIELAPKPTKHLLDRALVAMSLNENQQAVDLLGRLLEDNPNDISALYQVALCRTRLGQVNLSIETYRRILELDPSHLDSHINLGVQLARQDDVEAAREVFEQALAWAPYSARLLYNLGTLHFEQRRFTDARQAFKTAVQAQPDYTDARFAYGLSLYATGERDRAAETLRALVQDDSNDAVARKAADMLERWGLVIDTTTMPTEPIG